jgi:AraC-like DNA-binding protein
MACGKGKRKASYDRVIGERPQVSGMDPPCGDVATPAASSESISAVPAWRNASAAGWIGVLSDQRIGGALTLMHADVGHRWIVGELASGVAMSRSAFALRFKATVGVSLSEYLRRWRMQLAERARRRKIVLGRRLGVDAWLRFGKRVREFL